LNKNTKKLKLKRYEVRSALPELFSSNAATPKLGAHVTCMHSLHSKCRERKKERKKAAAHLADSRFAF